MGMMGRVVETSIKDTHKNDQSKTGNNNNNPQYHVTDMCDIPGTSAVPECSSCHCTCPPAPHSPPSSLTGDTPPPGCTWPGRGSCAGLAGTPGACHPVAAPAVQDTGLEIVVTTTHLLFCVALGPGLPTFHLCAGYEVTASGLENMFCMMK